MSYGTASTTWALSSLVVLAAACTADSINVQVRSFDQAQEVTFLCFEAQAGDDGRRTALPLERCGDADASPGVLHAVVTQTRRGELAAVDLSADLNSDGLQDGEVLDLDGRIPGFTFFPVGELPSAVVVPPVGSSATGGPTHVYVANRGSQSISIVPVERLVRQVDGAALPAIPQDFSVREWGAVTDLILSNDGRRVFAAIPEAGAVLGLLISPDGASLKLETVIDLPVSAPTPVSASAEPDYCWSCAIGAVSVSESCSERIPGAFPDGGLAPRPPLALGPGTRPVRFSRDDEDGVPDSSDRIMVADEGQPLVHVLDGNNGVLLEQFSLSVPTLDLAVTPLVSSVVGGAVQDLRYIYAIDATDQSLLVADHSTRAVLPVSVEPGAPVDRVTLDERVLAIEVITPVATSEEEPGPTRLNGVFLALAASDGFMRFVDIEDREIQERSPLDGSCAGDELYYRRHRLRLNSLAGNGISLTTDPRVSREGESSSLDDLGQSGLELSLGAVSCQPDEVSVFGESERLCVTFDPWTVNDEVWNVEWEGSLPGSAAGRGELTVDTDGSTATLTAAVDFCSLGVIGSQNGGAIGGPPYAGDFLTVLGPLPPAFSTDCEDAFLDEFDELGRVAIPIIDSFEDGVRLGTPLPIQRGGRGARAVSYDELTECFGDVFARFEIRVGGRYLVSGNVSAFRHPVVASESELDPELGARCEVDPGNGVRVRAPHGQVFTNGRIRLLMEGVAPVFGEDASLAFATRESPLELTAFIGTLPGSLVYNSIDQRLYAVDRGTNGLVPYQLTVLESRTPIN